MPFALQRYTEPLEPSELAFLVKREYKDRRSYYKVLRILMFCSFLFPFAGSWYRAFEGAPNAFSIPRFFVSTTILLCLSVGSMYAAYRVSLRRVQTDIRQRTKTIETAYIERKQYMPQNNTYYFYISSPNKLSIEVSDNDYHRLTEGDEVNIEYATHSKLYLGYF